MASFLAVAGLSGIVAIAPVNAQGLTQPLGGGTIPATAGAETPSTGVVSPASPSGIELPTDYRLDTDDSLSIEVARHGDISRVIRVGLDGLIRLPRLKSTIQARGKTVPELTSEILNLLNTEADLVVRPSQLTVSVVGTRVRRIFIRGTAGKNGDFNLQNGWRITELVAVTGGAPQPERIKAQILNPKRPGPVEFDLARALKTPNSSDNVPLMEGDTVVLSLPQAKRLFVKGEGPGRGQHDIDEQYGLRQALVALGFSPTGATGDLRHARILRHDIPGDVKSPTTPMPVDLYTIMTDDNAPDVALQDLDTLDVPLSQNYIYVFGKTSLPKKYYLPEDRKTYLVDLMTLGDTAGDAKIGAINVWRRANPAGPVDRKSYDFGKFLSKGDEKQNPEIKAGDLVFVPQVKRVDPIGTIWQSWGLYGIVQALIPGARLH